MSNPLGEALGPVVDAFDEMNVTYYVGGSVASMTYGEYRSTADVDIVADVRLEHIPSLAIILQDDYYFDEVAVAQAVRDKTSFNLMHLDSMFKVDIFPVSNSPYAHEAVRRRRRLVVNSEPPVETYVSSPEDILLAKLRWYRMGNEVSDRQWRDILGIVKAQGEQLDSIYLRRWATEIKVADLLTRAFGDAGIE